MSLGAGQRAAAKLGLEWLASQSEQGAAKSLYDGLKAELYYSVTTLLSCPVGEECTGGQTLEDDVLGVEVVEGCRHGKMVQEREDPQ